MPILICMVDNVVADVLAPKASMQSNNIHFIDPSRSSSASSQEEYWYFILPCYQYEYIIYLYRGAKHNIYYTVCMSFWFVMFVVIYHCLIVPISFRVTTLVVVQFPVMISNPCQTETQPTLTIKTACAAPVCANTLRPRQDGRHFPDDIFKCIFSNENVWIQIKVSLNSFPKVRINNIPALV